MPLGLNAHSSISISRLDQRIRFWPKSDHHKLVFTLTPNIYQIFNDEYLKNLLIRRHGMVRNQLSLDREIATKINEILNDIQSSRPDIQS